MEKEAEKEVPEEPGTSEEVTTDDELMALRKELEQMREEIDREKERSKEYLNLAKRIQADFDNYKKRVQKEREQMIESASERIIYDLLGIIDDFERALDSPENEQEFKEGVRRIHTNITSLLRQHGLREIAEQQTFDPDLHEALCAEEGEEGKILEVYQKGYLLGNKVLRCSKVKVGKCSEKGDDDD